MQTAAETLRRGTIDVVSTPQPDAAIASLRGVSGISVRTTLGANWELLQFNLGHGGGGNPLLRKRFVRELYGGVAPGVPVNNTAFVPPQSRYAKPWWRQYAFSPAASRRILERNGCRRGPDAFYVCGGARLSFRLSTTTGNQLRELTVLLMQRTLRRAGIEARIDNAPPPVLFQRKESGDYDLVLFAWQSSPFPLGFSNLYGCRTASAAHLNDIGYCNRRVDALLKAANGELEEPRQYARTNEALRLMAHDLPILPLFQKPTLLVHRTTVHGVRDTARTTGRPGTSSGGGGSGRDDPRGSRQLRSSRLACPAGTCSAHVVTCGSHGQDDPSTERVRATSPGAHTSRAKSRADADGIRRGDLGTRSRSAGPRRSRGADSRP